MLAICRLGFAKAVYKQLDLLHSRPGEATDHLNVIKHRDFVIRADIQTDVDALLRGPPSADDDDKEVVHKTRIQFTVSMLRLKSMRNDSLFGKDSAWPQFRVMAKDLSQISTYTHM